MSAAAAEPASATAASATPPPWLAPATTTRFGIDRGVLPRHLDGPDGVGDQPAVVVGRRIQDPAREESRVLRPGGRQLDVGRVAGGPLAALAARVHHEVRVSGRRPREPLRRQPPAAPVPDELHDRGHALDTMLREQQPRPDRLSREPGERHVEDVERAELGEGRA